MIVQPTAVRTALRSAAKTVIGSGASGGGVAGLDILASVGTSTSPLTAISKAVTGVGFTPKAVIDFGIQHTAAAATTVAQLSLGAAQSTASRAGIAVSSNHGVTASDTDRRHTAAKMFTGLSATGSTLAEADLASFDADGLTRSWSAVSGAADILNHICLGGADLEVSLVQCQMNGTHAAQSFAHGLTGAPTGVLFFHALNNTAPPNTASTGLYASIGAWAGSSQFAATVFSSTGETTSVTRRMLATTASLGYINTANQRSMAVSTVDATNVNVAYPVTTSAFQTYFWMLCIRGAKCQVGTFDPYAGATITTTGITPKLFLPVFLPTGVTQSGIVNNNLLLSIGASDGTNNVSCGISDENGQTTSDARRFQSSSSLALYDDGGTKQFEATAAFSGESVVLTRTTNVQHFGEMGYLVIGR